MQRNGENHGKTVRKPRTSFIQNPSLSGPVDTVDWHRFSAFWLRSV